MKSKKKGTCALVEASSYGKTLLYRKSAAYWERLSQYFAIVILAVFPMLMGLNGYTAITEGKYILFKIFTFLYLIAAVLICIGYALDKKLWRTRKAEGFRKWDLPQILLTAFALWGLISAIVSPYSGLWEGQSRYEGVLSMLLYTVIFVLLSFWGEYWDYYIPAMAVMATVQSVICILQLFGVNLIYPEGFDYVSTRFVGTIGNIDCVGGIVAIVVPALTCGYVILETRWRYAMLSGAALLLLVEIFIDVDSAKMGLLFALALCLPFLVTGKRFLVRTLRIGAVFLAVFGFGKMFSSFTPVVLAPGKLSLAAVAAAIVLGAVSWLLDRKTREFKLPAKTISLIVAGVEALIVVAALVYLRGYEGSHALLVDIHNVLNGELTDGAGSGRGAVWKACVALMSAMPIFGCGPGAFYEAFMPYNREEWGVVFDFAHNDFLQVGVSMGYVGLAIYVAFLVVLFIKTIKAANRCPLVVIFASSVAGYLAHSFFAFSIAIVTPLFWVMAGLLDKLIRQMPKDAAAEGMKAKVK